MSEEFIMSGFVPVRIAAERAGYSYSMVIKLARKGRIESQLFYGRLLVNLQQVIDYKTHQDTLGRAKHSPRRYRKAPVPVEN